MNIEQACYDDYAKVTLSSLELTGISNALYHYWKISGDKDIDKLYADIIIANSLVKYGNVPKFELNFANQLVLGTADKKEL